MFERGDKGNAAADAGFVLQTDSVFLRQRQQFDAVLGDDLFIGGDDMLAAGNSPFQVVERRPFPADSLDDDINTGFPEKFIIIGSEKSGGHLFCLRAHQILRQDFNLAQDQRAPDLLRQFVRFFRQHPGNLPGNYPQPHQPDTYALFLHFSFPLSYNCLLARSMAHCFKSSVRLLMNKGKDSVHIFVDHSV